MSTCLNKVPDLPTYRAEGSSPKERAVVAGLRDREVTVNDIPNYTNFLKQLRGLSEYVGECGCPID